jgi:hypothetical protein
MFTRSWNVNNVLKNPGWKQLGSVVVDGRVQELILSFEEMVYRFKRTSVPDMFDIESVRDSKGNYLFDGREGKP